MHNFPSLISQLLPYDSRLKVNNSLPASLREYKTLLQALHAAISDLQYGRLDKFDALVGENGCHIRAVWLAIHASRCRVASISLLERVEKALVKVNSLLSLPSIRQLMKSNVSLYTILKQELDIDLTPEEMFIFQSYLLSEVKVHQEEPFSIDVLQTNNPKILKKFGDISGNFADILTSNLRQLLAENSVRYIRSIAASSQDSWLMHMVSEKFTITHNKLLCTPHFWTCKALLYAAIQASLPLVIHAKFVQNSKVFDDERVLFTTTSNDSYRHVKILETSEGHPAWIIQGIVNTNMSKEQWKTALCSRSISELFLAGAADHRPYPNPTLEAFSDIESEGYRTLALKEGYSSKNQSMFFIRHVYSSYIDQFGNPISGHLKLACNA